MLNKRLLLTLYINKLSLDDIIYREFLVCNQLTRRPCWCQYNRIFLEVEFSSQRREMLLPLDHQHGRRDVTRKPAIPRSKQSQIFQSMLPFRLYSKGTYCEIQSIFSYYNLLHTLIFICYCMNELYLSVRVFSYILANCGQ